MKKRIYYYVFFVYYLSKKIIPFEFANIQLSENYCFNTVWHFLFSKIHTFSRLQTAQNEILYYCSKRANITWHIDWPPPSPMCYLVTLPWTPPPLECHELFEWPLTTWFPWNSKLVIIFLNIYSIYEIICSAFEGTLIQISFKLFY